MPSRLSSWLTPAAWVAAVTAALLLVFPVGFPNYDTIYALVWGRELAHGVSPDYGAALPPTPHPLADLLGLVTTPLGDGAITVTMVVAYASLGLIGYLVYRLGSLWFDRSIGAVAAADRPHPGALPLQRPARLHRPPLHRPLPRRPGDRGEAPPRRLARPRPARPAGLLRPEAWLFAGAYWLWLALEPTASVEWKSAHRPLFGWELGGGGAPGAGARWLAALALAGPVLWVLFDWITTGSPTYSFTGTRETVETLKRQTGPVDLVLYGPRRLGEVLQWPGMVGALGGVVLGFAFLRRRSALGIAAAVLALGAFALLACAGLAIIARYTMLAGAVLAIFVAVALLGWRLLEPTTPGGGAGSSSPGSSR